MTKQEFDAKVEAAVAQLAASDTAVLLAWENVCVYSGFAEDDTSEECFSCFCASLEGQAT